MAGRHELPTHLNVADKALWGLSSRQLMFLLSGLATAYSCWSQLVWLPLPVRLLLAGLCGGAGALLAWLRPHGRGLDEWLLVAARFAVVPRRCVWRPHLPDPSAAHEVGAGRGEWEELAPAISWRDGQ